MLAGISNAQGHICWTYSNIPGTNAQIQQTTNSYACGCTTVTYARTYVKLYVYLLSVDECHAAVKVSLVVGESSADWRIPFALLPNCGQVECVQDK